MKLIFISIIFVLAITFFFVCKIKKNKFDYDFTDIDIVYFINLKHRKDRLIKFKKEMKEWGIPERKIKRISAVFDKSRRDLSCSRSHIKTLEEFIKSSNKNCIIFEDDFEFYDPDKARKDIHYFFSKNIPYDVVMLSSNTIIEEKTIYPFLNKIINAQTASGYLINKSFALTLLENYKEGEKLFNEAYDNGDKKDYIYAVDQYWKKLQPISNWYVFNPKLGKQRESFSDIQGGIVNYNV